MIDIKEKVAFDTLKDWLTFLENRHQQEMQLGLGRVKAVAQRLKLLTPEAIVITVGGTNGKGSTVAALESIYRKASYKVGSYTSPHLLYFNERIRINGHSVSDEKLCEVFTLIEHERGDIHLTYFEVATLAALCIFKESELDVILLEVGLGGRLDATNIIDADLALITTIDYDHQEFLGDSKEDIGFEKAGIMRPFKPCIYADNTPPQRLLDHAEILNSPLLCLNKEFTFIKFPRHLKIVLKNAEIIEIPIPVINIKNAVASIIAALCLREKLPVLNEHIIKGINETSLPGRLTLKPGRVNTLLDVAHNPQAARTLADFVSDFHPKKKVHAVFSALKDKDLCGLIRAVAKQIDYWYPAVLACKRAADASDIEQAFRKTIDENLNCFSSPWLAYQEACNCAEPDDLIVVFGSFWTVNSIAVEGKLLI